MLAFKAKDAKPLPKLFRTIFRIKSNVGDSDSSQKYIGEEIEERKLRQKYWNIIATWFDRISFYLYIFLIVSTSVICLCLIPSFAMK